MGKTLRTAKTAEEKIAIIEELLAIMPKHKGTTVKRNHILQEGDVIELHL